MSPRESLPAFSAHDVARAAGVPVEQVQAWIEAGAIRTLDAGDGQTWIAQAEAVRAGRAILAGTIGAALPVDHASADAWFEAKSPGTPTIRSPFAVSTSLHAGLVAAVVLVTTLGLGGAGAQSTETVAPLGAVSFVAAIRLRPRR